MLLLLSKLILMLLFVKLLLLHFGRLHAGSFQLMKQFIILNWAEPSRVELRLNNQLVLWIFVTAQYVPNSELHRHHCADVVIVIAVGGIFGIINVSEPVINAHGKSIADMGDPSTIDFAWSLQPQNSQPTTAKNVLINKCVTWKWIHMKMRRANGPIKCVISIYTGSELLLATDSFN